MTRLYGTLPTLEGAISDANQGSLPVDGQSFPGGLVPAGSHQWLSGARYFLYRFSFRFGSSLGYERHPRLTGLWLAPEGSTEGQTVVFTPKRKGLVGWCFNRILLRVTRLVASYFSVGDTKVFQTIRFRYRTPVPADRAVQAFISHLERQPLADWPLEKVTSSGRREKKPVPTTSHEQV